MHVMGRLDLARGGGNRKEAVEARDGRKGAFSTMNATF